MSCYVIDRKKSYLICTSRGDKYFHIEIHFQNKELRWNFFLPAIVFCIQQEICANNGHTHRYDDQDEEHQEHETKHKIDLVRPERSKDKVPKNKTIMVIFEK